MIAVLVLLAGGAAAGLFGSLLGLGGGILIVPLLALALGLPLQTIGLQFGIGAAALVLGFAMYAVRWIGGGDAKLFAAAALWIGWPAAVTYLGLTGIAGGALAVALLGLRSAYVRPFIPSGPAWLARLIEPGESVPYGVAIAADGSVDTAATAALRRVKAVR